MKKLPLLFLIPSVVIANIYVTINASRKEAERFSGTSGSDNNIIDNKELNLFQLSEDKMKDIIASKFGMRPDDVYVKSKTPWGDLYSIYNWPQVNRTLTAVRTEIIEANYDNVDIATKYLKNTKKSKVKKVATIGADVKNTVTSTWPNYGELAAVRIHYDISIKSTFNETSFNYDSNWGETVDQSRSFRIEEKFKVSLRRGQRAKAELQASKGVLKFRIDYEATLSGIIAINYDKLYRGHHFYGMEVNYILHQGGLKTTVSFSEVITITHYSSKKVVVRDRKTNQILKTYTL